MSIPRWSLVLPAVALLTLVIAIPLAIFVVYSFLHGEFFEVTGPLTLANFTDALADDVARSLAINSFQIGLATAAITVILGVPTAYIIRFRIGRLEYPVLFLLIFTMFASYLARIYAWRAILGEDGLIQTVSPSLGLGRPELLFTKTAVVLALVHIYLPFVILVIYAALRNLPPEMLQLSADLGASPIRRFVSVVLPISATGIASSFLYVFVLSASDYITPQFLGGRQAQMVGVLIQSNFTQKGDYPAGAAMALVLLVTFVVVYAVVASTVRLVGLNRVAVRSG